MPGLSTAEAAARLQTAGPNALPERPPDPAWRRFLRQFASPLIYILLFALAFDVGLWTYGGIAEWPVDAVAIAVILLLNAGLGLYQERRSEQALAHLRQLAGTHAWVLRDGQLETIAVARDREARVALEDERGAGALEAVIIQGPDERKPAVVARDLVDAGPGERLAPLREGGRHGRVAAPRQHRRPVGGRDDVEVAVDGVHGLPLNRS